MSQSNRQFNLALEALAELKTEITTSPPTQPAPAAPTLSKVLADFGSIPREALFLGIASDGLPVLLNLHDPVPGPILVIGDRGAGKTIFLQTIAHSLTHLHKPEDVQYSVISNHSDKWQNFSASHCAGTFSSHEKGAQDLLLSLASWAHANKNARQSVLLLIDDLEALISMDFDALQNLRWLLARGPSRRVWPIITLTADRYGKIIPWLENFRTRIFGKIENQKAADALSCDPNAQLDRLHEKIEFALREGNHWLKFWIPNIE